MKTTTKLIVELDHIRKVYRSKQTFFRSDQKKIIALECLSMKIKRGEILGLVGESGSGKTTIGRLIVKLENPDTGKIYLDDKDISLLKRNSLKNFRSRLQMIFQDPYQSLNPQLSVFDTVVEPLIIHKIGDSTSRQKQVNQSLELVDLKPPADFLDSYPHQLSGGQRQRVAIARAIVLKPEFIVADEPTSMLDATVQLQIFDILLELKNKLNITILFITHSITAARYLCDRIAVIYRGHLMEQGPAQDVMTNPKHPYTKALIDAHPKFGYANKKQYKTLLKTQREPVNGECCPFFIRCEIAKMGVCDIKTPELKKKHNHHSVACFFS